MTQSLAKCSAHPRSLRRGKGQRKKELRAVPSQAAYLRQDQGALAGLETLGALRTQLGVSYLFTSVRGKGKLGN